MALVDLVHSKHLPLLWENRVIDLLNSKSSSACGLALFIGCKTSCDPKHAPLDGVEGDLRLLHETFSKLGFDTVELLDPTKEEIGRVVKVIAEKYRRPTYKYIVMSFSGHGDQTGLFSRTESLDLMSDIVQPIISTNPCCC